MISKAAFALLAFELLSGPGWAAERATARGEILGKQVIVEYGRVSLGGRPLSALIEQLPEDRVWRAGTDEVSTLTTEGDLSVDSLSGVSCSRVRGAGPRRKVPAGTYSLYVSAPREGEWSLILNSDPGIELGALGKLMGFEVPGGDAVRRWPHLEGYNLDIPKGVAGISSTEVARIVMKPGRSNAPVDPFTISLSPSGPESLIMTLAWGEQAWAVDLNAAPLELIEEIQ